MKKLLAALLVTYLGASADPIRAADDPKAIIEKGIKALGGEDKLTKAKALSWKNKGKFFFQGNPNDISSEATVEGLDHVHTKFVGDFGGQKVEGLTILAGDKGWRTFPELTELDADALANEKRITYLMILPITLVALKENAYKLEPAKEEQVDGKAAVGVKVTGPDKKDFTFYFDKENGLPVKVVAKVISFMGEEVTQETSYGGYKDFDGIKKATKIEGKQNGEKIVEMEVTEFKVLDKVDPKLFSKPE
jgi:hypothetical protein